jgi:hypothetical protein
MTLKIAVLAPMPSAGVEIAVLAPIFTLNYRTSSSRHHRGVSNPDRDVDPGQLTWPTRHLHGHRSQQPDQN